MADLKKISLNGFDADISEIYPATDDDYGTVKLNSDDGIIADDNGRLDIDGRLGQFEGTKGLYSPRDREPRMVADYSLLITDAKGMVVNASRSLVITTGLNQTLNGTHPAGSTSYEVANTYENRIKCAGIKYVALSESDAKQNQIKEVISCTIGGEPFTPDSSANDSSNPIIITVAESANPSSAVSQLRVMGAVLRGFSSEYIGQCISGDAGGGCLFIGQNVFNLSGNANAVVGQSMYSSGNGNACFGRQIISTHNRWLLSGTGHDNTNGRDDAGAAIGKWSSIDANTLFAVGNGTSQTKRLNAFEVRPDGIVLRSPNGTRFKISVDDNGELITTAL